MKSYITCFDWQLGDNVIGGSYSDGIYTKKTDPEKHLVRKFKAYGIQKSIIEKLKELGCKEIHFKEPKRTLKTPFSDWIDGYALEENIGCGPQLFIRPENMEVV